MSTSDGAVHLRREGPVAHVTFDRPAARNAMTWAMYEGLSAACEQIAADPEVRVAVFRGAGGKAFVAGTDIAQFRDFKSGEDGVRYERVMERHLAAVEELKVPTLAVVEGWAVGGGLAIATACDLRIATPGSRFGVPIARTLGNCLSVGNIALIAGFLSEIVPAEGLDARVAEICMRLASSAPVTLRVTKEAIRRLTHAGIPEGDDLILEAYGSRDFRIGVEAFVEKREPRWTGS